jgi:transposase InsO family protein
VRSITEKPSDLWLSADSCRAQSSGSTLLQEAGCPANAECWSLSGCLRCRRKRTTRRDSCATPAADLLERNFTAAAPNKIWTADITYIHTQEGFLYLAFILDVYSRRVVGWAMATHLRTELVVGALEMALWRRKPDAGLIHHTDRGTQYTALSHSERDSKRRASCLLYGPDGLSSG